MVEINESLPGETARSVLGSKRSQSSIVMANHKIIYLVLHLPTSNRNFTDPFTGLISLIDHLVRFGRVFAPSRSVS